MTPAVWDPRVTLALGGLPRDHVTSVCGYSTNSASEPKGKRRERRPRERCLVSAGR